VIGEHVPPLRSPRSPVAVRLCLVFVAALIAVQQPGASAEAQQPLGTLPALAEPGPAEADEEIITEEPDAPERDALAHNAALLDELFEQSTQETVRQQKFAAAAGITGGMILVGLSAWRLIEDEPQIDFTRGLGGMFMTLGMADLTTGVFAATRVPHEERRLERWKRARENGITAVELAHFEGEIQASRGARKGERLLVRWNGLTHAIAGALVLAFTPIPSGSSGADRASGYVVGAIFMATGLAAFGTSFRPTPSERAWQEYNKRKIPMPGHEFSWRLGPSISRRGAGLSFGATF
jgi:hypothetical protein